METLARASRTWLSSYEFITSESMNALRTTRRQHDLAIVTTHHDIIRPRDFFAAEDSVVLPATSSIRKASGKHQASTHRARIRHHIASRALASHQPSGHIALHAKSPGYEHRFYDSSTRKLRRGAIKLPSAPFIRYQPANLTF